MSAALIILRENCSGPMFSRDHYLNANGNVSEYRQLHGRVVQVDARRVIQLILRGQRDGEEYWLPPDTRNFEKARLGEYRLRATGEVVEDPDYLTTWTITPPDKHHR